MAKTDLLKEAIADAKAVRETALANAKIALEEAFTPRIQSMLSAKLAEDEEVAAEEPAMEEPAAEPAPEPPVEEDMAGEEAPVDEIDEYEAEGEGGETMVPEAEEEEMAEAEDAELEEILRELESEEEPVAEASDSSDIGKGDNKLDYADSKDQDDPGKGKLKENEGEEKVEEAEDKEEVSEAEDAEKDLEEAYNVIRFLKSKINEVNLLNAKLLFSNKLFRNHSLNEGQKMKVIENFDRAQSLREVKLVFATLSESFNINGRKAKRTIKESYASKPSRSTAPKKQVISEGSQLQARWKKLANL